MTTDTNTATTESLAARIGRLIDGEISPTRMESLELAHGLVDDDTFTDLALADRLGRGLTVTLPAHRYEHLSRGRGWCRMGHGDTAEWGERTPKGYRVGPGRWTVGASDGFSRQGKALWTVRHIPVGDSVWTVAMVGG